MAKSEALLLVSSVHEFEGQMSGELSGEIFGWHCQSRRLENSDDVRKNWKIDLSLTCKLTEIDITRFTVPNILYELNSAVTLVGLTCGCYIYVNYYYI